MSKRKKFLLTLDLYKLAKRLRFIGYDTKVIRSISLLNLIRIAKKEDRIVISRSKKVLNHPLDFPRIFVKSSILSQQLSEISFAISFEDRDVFSRCPEDNDLLTIISKDKISSFIPEEILSQDLEFKICKKCGRIYWKGTHYEAMVKDIRKVLLHHSG